MKTKIINGVKYELEQHDNNKMLSEMNIKKGWRLLYPWEAQRLWDLGYLRDNWFYVKNTNKELSKDYVARFDASSLRANFDCGRSPSYAYSSLGVVLCKDEKVGEE